MNSKVNKNSLKVVEVETLPKTPLRLKIFNRDIKYLKVKDIKRAYSKLIQDYCKGLVSNEDSKTIAYLFSGYLQMIHTFELEQKIEQIEKKLNISGGFNES